MAAEKFLSLCYLLCVTYMCQIQSLLIGSVFYNNCDFYSCFFFNRTVVNLTRTLDPTRPVSFAHAQGGDYKEDNVVSRCNIFITQY